MPVSSKNDEPRGAADTMRLPRDRGRVLVLIAATALGIYLCGTLAFPFLPAIIWALTLAVLTYPLHHWIASRVRPPALAAALALTTVGIVIVAPAVFVVHRLVVQASGEVEGLKSQIQSGNWRETLESNPVAARALAWIEPNLDVRSVVEQVANSAGSALSFLFGGSIWTLTQLVITFFTLFYFYRDRKLILERAKSLVPLPRPAADRLFARVSDTIHATIYGTAVVALAQGVLGGLMFWWLDLPAVLFWGMVMTLFALIPVLGAPVVWIPAAIFLAITGNWSKAAILTAWGVIVIGSIDNLLYPMLVGDKMRMHTLLVFFSVVGGLLLFGASGIVVGPAVVAVTDVLLEVWQQSTTNRRS